MKTAGIALGSNLGDRGNLMIQAFNFLQRLSADGSLKRSQVIETEPLDCPPGSAPFLNAAAEIAWKGSARDLLDNLQQFERDQGRPNIRPLHAPRPIDLDLLYLDDEIIHQPDLILPHPRIGERVFVLQPLSELCPERILPGQTRPVKALLNDIA